MKRAIASALTLVSALMASQSYGWVTIIDTGFEDYSLGSINGQHGWTAYAGSISTVPTVIDSVTGPAFGQKSVAIYAGRYQGGGYSYMGVSFDDLVAGGYKLIQISFDVYRDLDAYDQDFLWWMPDEGVPNGGRQDYLKGTIPFYSSSSGHTVPTIFGAYAHVELTWNLNTNRAYSWYNGSVVDDGIGIPYLDSSTGWQFYLTHDGPGTNFGDTAYIDNFKVLADTAVPEPATIAVVGAGMLALARRRRR